MCKLLMPVLKCRRNAKIDNARGNDDITKRKFKLRRSTGNSNHQ